MAEINGEVDFCRANIKGSANFIHAEIDGDVDFIRATINEGVDFLRAKINGEASFYDAIIKQYARFTDATIDGDADFSDVRIEGNSSFSHATIKGGADFSNARIGRAMSLDDVTIIGHVRFATCSARSIYLGTERPRVRGWRLGVDRCGIAIRDARASSFWRFARITFSKNGERDAADAAFYFERIWHWKALRKVESGRGVRLKRSRTALLRIGYWVLWALDCLLLRWTTAYGASIARLFTTWFVVIGGFGIAFSLRPCLIQGPSGNGPIWEWIRGFHYSATTFATLGLGNVGLGSSRLGMLLTSIEALLGAVLIALAVLVIGRRFMR